MSKNDVPANVVPIFRSDFDCDLIDTMGTDVRVAQSAWVCTSSDARVAAATADEVSGVLKFLMKNRHGTPFESCIMQVRLCLPIFLWREWHRHRIASYNEESGRYKQLDPVFYVPSEARRIKSLKPANFKPSRPGFAGFLECPEGLWDVSNQELKALYTEAYRVYSQRLALGLDNGLARVCLPVGIYSSCYVTMNLRGWMNFLSLRVDSEASLFRSHPLWELHTCVAGQVEPLFAEHFPITYKHFVDSGRVAP